VMVQAIRTHAGDFGIATSPGYPSSLGSGPPRRGRHAACTAFLPQGPEPTFGVQSPVRLTPVMFVRTLLTGTCRPRQLPTMTRNDDFSLGSLPRHATGGHLRSKKAVVDL
jgi:hypothetical protein